jgi:hypothetical protein
MVGPEIADRFWKHVEKVGNGCWLWTGCGFKNGYGRMRFGNYTRVPHRVAYELEIGAIPEGMLVLHKCDIRLCCNPDHLFLGTDLDNVHDCQKKNRRAHLVGEEHPMAKLTAGDVVEIRKRRSRGDSLKNIGNSFLVTTALIGMIVNRKIWRHI